MPVDKTHNNSPVNLLNRQIDRFSKEDSFCKKEIFSRITCAVLYPLATLASIPYHAAAAVVRVPVGLCSAMNPLSYRTSDNSNRKFENLKQGSLHLVKIAFCFANILLFPIIGTVGIFSPEAFVRYHKFLGLVKNEKVSRELISSLPDDQQSVFKDYYDSLEKSPILLDQAAVRTYCKELGLPLTQSNIDYARSLLENPL